MKNLLQYINEHQKFIEEYCELIDTINLEIIVESFGCKILKELADQQTNLLEEWKDKKAANQYAYLNKPLDLNYLFKNSHVLWDKITDDKVQTFKGADPDGLKLFKRICSNRSNSVNGMIILESTEEGANHKYASIIIKEYTWVNYYSCATDRGRKELKPSEATEYLTQNTTYHIIVLDDTESRDKLRLQRNTSRNGVITPGDIDQLKRLADQNRERYKKIAAKLKVERQAAADKFPEEVNECVDRVMKLTIEFAKNPVKYNKFQYEISKLMELVSDKEVGYYDRGKYHKYGINGLMYYFSSYLKSKLTLAKGTSSDYDQREFEASKKKLREMIDKINTSYNEIMQKVEEQNKGE